MLTQVHHCGSSVGLELSYMKVVENIRLIWLDLSYGEKRVCSSRGRGGIPEHFREISRDRPEVFKKFIGS